MKRLIALLGILVLVGAIAVPVLAHGPGWGRGHHMGWGGGPGYGYCGDYGPGAGNLTEEQRTQLDNLHKKFYDETAQLRNKMWTKSSELNALLNSPNPDADKARALQKEITGLRSQLAEKRLDPSFFPNTEASVTLAFGDPMVPVETIDLSLRGPTEVERSDPGDVFLPAVTR